jgi:hypothetical protein
VCRSISKRIASDVRIHCPAEFVYETDARCCENPVEGGIKSGIMETRGMEHLLGLAVLLGLLRPELGNFDLDSRVNA